MLKNITRRTWSVLIALIMIWTTFCIGQPLTASAAVSKGSTAINDAVYFVVPEAIYLKPVWNSNTTEVSNMPFQWYVNNTLSTSGSVTPNTGEESEGSLYFRYAGASTAKISFEWLSSNGQAASGGSIKVNGSTISAGSTVNVNSSNNAVKITSGSSPKMAGSTTGAYIRWTATFTDSKDNRTKTAQAYTYVYKPYVQPVGVALRTINDRGTPNHYGANLSWISGVHDTTAAGDHYPNTSGNGLLAFSSSDSGSSAPLVGSLYAQLPSNFKYEGISNTGSVSWLNQTSSPQYLPDKSFRYSNNELTGHSSGDDAFHNLGYAATGYMTIDISRYTKLEQIPNLSIGLMVTDDENSSTGAAYFVSNYTGDPATADDHDYFKNNTGPAETIWNRYNKAGGDIFKAGTYADPSASEAEGIKYNGRWTNKTLETSVGESTYYVGTGYFNHQGSGSHYGGDTIWNVGELRMKVQRYNKSTLRTAVQNAINKAPVLQSMFYGASAEEWTTYTNLFRAASMALTKLDGKISVSANGKSYTDTATLVTDLNKAVTTLTGGSGRVTGRTAKQTNVVLQPQGSSYVYAEFKNGSTTNSATFTTYDTVTFTTDNVSGYTFQGLVRATTAPNFVIGSTAEYPSSFTTSEPGATISNGTVKYIHTDTTGTDGDGNLYYTYYYTPINYTVRYNANGGSGTMADQAFVYNVAQSLTTNTFTRSGYTFKGWAESSTGSVKYANGATVNCLTTTANSTVPLYAVWQADTYTIRFDPLGGSIEGTPPSTYSIDTTVTLPNATKIGYALQSWRANDAGNWGPLTYSVGVPVSGKYGNVQFTAVWIANSYVVKFDPNGGSGTAMNDQNFVYGQAQNLSANTYSRDGYSFRGWARTSGATDPEFIDKASVQDLTTSSNGVVSLYAIWGANTYRITYSTDGGTIRDTDYTRDFTVNTQIALPTNVEKTGYSFSGWKPSTVATGSNWDANTVYNGTLSAGKFGNVTLLAQWAKVEYTISYDLQGGSYVSTRYTTVYDVTTTIIIPAARKVGYNFNGWQADGGGTWGVGIYQAGNIAAGTKNGNVSMTALYTGITYFVSFNGNDSTGGVMYNQTFVYGTPSALTPNEYVRNGYQFVGWSQNQSDTNAKFADGAEVDMLTTNANATITLYAIWHLNSYSITYDEAGGTITTPGMTLYTTNTVVTLPVVERDGYTLQGWIPLQNSGSWHTWETYNTSVAAGSYGDVTLVASWKKDVYTITYDAQGGSMSGTYTTTYDIDTVIVLPSVSRTGYIFGGWSAGAAWNNVIVTDTAPANARGNVKLTALWTQQVYYIRFNPNGGTGNMSDQLVRFDESATLTRNKFARDGYNFAGWATSETGSTSYTDGDIVLNLTQTQNGVVNLYAVWSARNFSLAYNFNGAENVSLPPQNVIMDGDAVTLRAYNVETTIINDVAYTFAGWAYTKADADNGIVAYANKAPFSLNATVLEDAEVNWSTTKPTITLYAVWNDITIELIAAEGSTTVFDTDRSFIYGLKVGVTKEELETQYLDVVGKGHLEFSSGRIGTGTTVDLISDISGETLQTYTIIIFGDVNGDGQVNSTDVTKARNMSAKLEDSNLNDNPYAFAANVNVDNVVNSSDVTTLRSMAAKLFSINQATRARID